MSLFDGELINVLNKNIEIDTYTGKLFDTSIVVVIKSQQRDALLELESFIETGIIPVLDAETSEYANDNEDFLLFLEFERHPLFTKRLSKLLKQMEYLTYNNKWSFTTLHQNKPIELNEDNLKKYLPLMTTHLKRQQIIKEFFKNSKNKPYFDYNYIVFKIFNAEYYFNFIEEISQQKLQNYINKYKVKKEFYQSTIGKNIKKIFGNDFNIIKIGKIYIFKNDNNKYITLSQKSNQHKN